MRDYIPVKKHWFGMYLRLNNSNKKQYYTPHLKFPIEKIRVDISHYADKQEMFRADVFYMLVNFDRTVWEPVIINKSGLLLDGYHRVEAAKQMGLFFIDLVIEDTELLESNDNKASDGKYSNIKKLMGIEEQDLTKLIDFQKVIVQEKYFND